MLFGCAKLDNKRHGIVKGQIILIQAIHVKQKGERSLRLTEEIQEGFMGAAGPRGPAGERGTAPEAAAGAPRPEAQQVPGGRAHACTAEGRGLGVTVSGGHRSLEKVTRVKFQNRVSFLIKVALPGLWLHCFFSISI